jgi:hypothetical protein
MPKTQNMEIRCAADAMIERYGDRAADEAAQWSNCYLDRGDVTKYEFWQWVCMDIQHRDFPVPVRKRVTH